MNRWYELSIARLLEIVPGSSKQEKIQNAYDLKYGNYQYQNDLRIICEEQFDQSIQEILAANDIEGIHNKVLIAGANSGEEVKNFGGQDIFALDLSPIAIRRVVEKFPYVKANIGNVEDLPYEDNQFDVYCCFRTLQSRYIDLDKAFEQANRTLRSAGVIIVSIPNGYLVDGQVVNGLWNSDKQEFDNDSPQLISQDITNILEERYSIKTKQIEIASEIIIYGKKP